MRFDRAARVRHLERRARAHEVILHIDDDEPVCVLGQDIDAADLGDRVSERGHFLRLRRDINCSGRRPARQQPVAGQGFTNGVR